MFFKKEKKRRKRPSITVKESTLQKIPVGELSPGMYVAELDIPWEDSPFLFQGFKLQNWEDVDAVISCCKEVTIDIQQTEKINLPRNAIDQSNRVSHGKLQKVDTRSEINNATKHYNQASKLVVNMMDDIRLGKAIDTEGAKQVVS